MSSEVDKIIAKNIAGSEKIREIISKATGDANKDYKTETKSNKNT